MVMMGVLWGTVGMAFAVDDGIVEAPTTGALGAAIAIPSTAVSAATAVPVYDFQIVNPSSAGSLPIMVDRMLITFGTTPADLGGMKVMVSGTSSPTFSNTDGTIVDGVDPSTVIDYTLPTLTLGPAQDGDGAAGLLQVADGDTVVVTVYAWLAGAITADATAISVDLATFATDILMDTGYDGLNPLEPQADMALKKVKDSYGDRICLLGNIDCVDLLPNGTPDEVDTAVAQAIEDAGAGGGLVICSSNSLHPGVNPENCIAMFEATKKHGKY